MKRVKIAALTCLTMGFTSQGVSCLIVPGSWQITLACLTVLLSLAVALPVCLLRRRPGLGQLLGALIGAYVFVVFLCDAVAPNQTPGRLVPTLAALNAVAAHCHDAIQAMYTTVSPTGQVSLFLPVALACLGFITWLCLCLALVVDAPVWIGVPAACVWLIFVVADPGQGIAWFIVAAVAYLLVVGVARGPNRATAARLCVLVLTTALAFGVCALAPQLPDWGVGRGWRLPWVNLPNNSTDITVVGTINIGDQLHQDDGKTIFTTTGSYDGVLKMSSLYSFDGKQWSVANQRNVISDQRVYTLGSQLWPSIGRGPGYGGYGGQNVRPGVWGQPEDLTVNLPATWAEDYLPLGTGPRTISSIDWGKGSIPAGAATGLTYYPVLDSLGSDSSHSPRHYSMSVSTLDQSVLGFANGSRRPPAGPALGSSSSVDSLPHASDIRKLAEQVTKGATTQNQQLKAIETWLKGPAFTYTLTPRWGDDSDPVWDFLTYKQGYCIHFATAMYVMGSLLGIPMRVSVGYLPGTLGSDGVRSITNADAHMWPEAYYSGVGWAPYEPTPSTSQNAGPGQPTATPSSVPDTPEPSQSSSVQPSTAPTSTSAPQAATTALNQSQPSPSWAGLAIGLGAGVFLVLVAMLMWVANIRRYSPERAWRAIEQMGRAAGVLVPGQTVSACAHALTDRIPQRGITREIEGLASYIELTRYAPADSSSSPPIQPSGKKLWRLRWRIKRELSRRRT